MTIGFGDIKKNRRGRAPLITDPPLTSFTNLSICLSFFYTNMWHVTHDTYYLTCDKKRGGEHCLNISVPLIWKFWSIDDMWHRTHDTWLMKHHLWHMAHKVWRTLCQNLRSLALTVWEVWCFEYLEEKYKWLNEWIIYWMNDKGLLWGISALACN